MTEHSIVQEQNDRYAYLRDHGHLDFVQKYRRCDRFYLGHQWDLADRQALANEGRPALTINKILPTIANVVGTQIQNRSEPVFKPRGGLADEGVANTLTKLFMHTADQNGYHWKKSTVFQDGLIGSRGFFDIRMCFQRNLFGDVKITVPNPTDVLIDGDADEYEPKSWADVIHTRWIAAREFERLYGKDKLQEVKAQGNVAGQQYDYDQLNLYRKRFGNNVDVTSYAYNQQNSELLRDIRVIERQVRELTTREYFVDLGTGDMTPIPDDADEELVRLHLQAHEDLAVIEREVTRVKWIQTAGTTLLYDDWSLYEDFTIVPFFPYFRRGDTMGVVENLLDPQQVLNKIRSQELHVVNTTANSGWILRKNNLLNMDMGEFENRGAESGLVLEVEDPSEAGIRKITPNQVPTGLDRLSFKAEEDVKSISGVSDYQTGFAREDVSAKAVQANQQMGTVNITEMLDNLRLTEMMLAKKVLKLFQQFYTDERTLRIITDKVAGDTEEVVLNELQEDGTVLNDVSVGEYDVIISSQPERDTFEESQFDQAVMLRQELGIPIKDEYVVRTSQIQEKREVIEDLRAQAESPEAQHLQELEMAAREAEVEKSQAEALKLTTDAEHNRAKTTRDLATANQRGHQTMSEDEERAAQIMLRGRELALEERRVALEEREAAWKEDIESRRAAAEILAQRAEAAQTVAETQQIGETTDEAG